MQPDIESLGIDRLSVDERISLVTAIWNSIADEPRGSLLTPEQKTELDRRLAEHRANPDTAIPWEEVKARLQSRLKP